MSKVTVDIEFVGLEEFEASVERASAAIESLAETARQANEALGVPVGRLAFLHRLRIKVIGWLLGQ